MPSKSTLNSARELLRRAVRRSEAVAVVYHADADGIASAALACVALERSGGITVPLTPEKGHNVYDADFDARLARLAPATLLMVDTGARAGARFGPKSTKSIVVDHHPCEAPPEVACFVHDPAAQATATLVHALVSELADLSDRDWLVALGLLGDAGTAAQKHALVAQASARYGAKTLRELVALINASGRASAHTPEVALEALRQSPEPGRIVRGASREAQQLAAMRAEVANALQRARRVAPRVRGRWAIIELDEPCRVHGVIASAWTRRLSPRIVLVANRGYVAGRVHISVRSHLPIDLRSALRSLLPDAGPDYAAGHERATGAIMDLAAYARLLAALEREGRQGRELTATRERAPDR